MSDGWYKCSFTPDLDLDAAGIYEWRIEGIGIYVGKAKRLRSRIYAYPRNVARMLRDLPWHGRADRPYRPIHHALRQAYESRTLVSVCVLEVCTPELRLERERYWIERRRQEELAGGPKLLNATREAHLTDCHKLQNQRYS